MIELIIIIIVVVSVYQRVQRTKEGGVKGSSAMPNITVTTSNPPNVNKSGNAAFSGRRGGATMGQPGSMPQRQPGSMQQRQSAQSAIQEAKEDGHSTTAYLAEKAEADAREHAREKFEEQKRLYETRGGLAVAERFLEGDLVPQGKRCVSCGYCGAENLIPITSHANYSCYFCREPLD